METITSRQNDRVKRVAALSDDVALRAAQGLCVVHGVKLCGEAMRQGADIAQLWLTEPMLADSTTASLRRAAGEIFVMSDSVRDKLSPQRSPQDLLAVVSIPKQLDVDALARRSRLILLCDIQDPANVGAILRSAAALGYGGALLAGACADPWSPKSLRAGMGAQFSVALATGLTPLAAIADLQQAGHTVLATALRDDARDVTAVSPPSKLTLAVGNEGAGLPDAVIAACDAAVAIPITDAAESLNAAAAAAIAMWELRDGR